MEISRLESEDELSAESDFPLTRIYDKFCPIYMSYGMSYEEYWYGDSIRCKFYRESHELKQKQIDELLWMGGMYIYDTICRVQPILNDFAKPGTKPLPYIEKPYTQSVEFRKTQEKISKNEQDRLAEQERLRAKIHFNNLARMLDKQFNKDTKKEKTKETEVK